MFRIKICGITNVDDARAVAQAGADAIGLNFYSRSPRYVTAEVARDIVKALPAEIVKVGLFVDTPAGDVCRLFDDLPLDLIQLHGDQPPEFLTQLGDRPVMRAFRLGPEGLRPVAEYLTHCRALAVLPKLVLLDAMVAGAYGGTGKTADWAVAKQYAAVVDVPPLVLAGGLTPENVAAAIRAVKPAAVDVASGVECQPGRKDPSLVGAFVQAAREAFP
jgi:phosphoribosylanthranilate isomerase